MKRVIFLTFLVGLLALPAAGHGTSLSLSRSQVQPGERIKVKGGGWGENAVIELTLEGALNTYPLGKAQGNAHGEFQAEVLIPAEAKPGNYTLNAQAGTTAASAPLRVAPGGAPAASEPGAEGTAEERASLEPLQLDRSWSRSETAVVWALIVAAALVGGLLWFRK